MAGSDAERKQMFRKKMEETPDPLEKLRYACLMRGVNGIKGLARTFRIYDDDGSKSLSLEEFIEGIRDYGVKLDKEQMQELFMTFDKDGSGTVNFDEFLVALQPPLNKARLAVIDSAFKKADRSGDGVFTAKDLKGLYSVNKHPKFLSGEWDEAQVFEEFLNSFDTTEKDGKVTKKEFIEYYANVSASIDNDAYFDLMVRNAWKL